MALIKIGTRGSKLALFQANYVKNLLEEKSRSLELDYSFELIPIKTTGDKIQDKALYDVGGKALFIKEIEEALLMDEIDIAVHSMKDVPAFFPDSLGFHAILPRGNVLDAFISVKYDDIRNLPNRAKVGTTSVRRTIQLKKLRPDLDILPLRGNIDSRIVKAQNGEFDAIILAAAGLERINITQSIYKTLPPDLMLPAISQGAIGVECKNDRADLRELLRKINHIPSEEIINIERAFQIEINGNCRTPIGAYIEKLDKNSRQFFMNFKHFAEEKLPLSSESNLLTNNKFNNLDFYLYGRKSNINSKYNLGENSSSNFLITFMFGTDDMEHIIFVGDIARSENAIDKARKLAQIAREKLNLKNL